jgi:hypothetical protein
VNRELRKTDSKTVGARGSAGALPYQLLTVDALSSHLRYAIRLLLKSPVFTITTILIGSLLYGVSASDPVALGTSVLVLRFAPFLAWFAAGAARNAN